MRPALGDEKVAIRPAWLQDSPVVAWSFAAMAFLAAFALRYALDSELPAGFPFLTFFPAVILTTFLAGLWPGTGVAIAGGLAAWYFFIPPFGTLALTGSSALALSFYGVIVAVDILIIHVMNLSLDRLKTEKARSAELAQRAEILFSELQHRISNNLSVVSALLNLQRADVEDKKAKQALSEASARLALIAKIQRKLHDPTGSPKRFGPFMEDLCRDVLEASGAREIDCRVAASDVAIAPDKTIPLALIVTELVSNALEHGFSGRRTGTIRVELAQEGANHVLTVVDDGHGLPSGFSLAEATTTGLRIVKALARQLGGQLAIDGSAGTTCRLVFPASDPENA